MENIQKMDNLRETMRMFEFYYNKYFETQDKDKIIYLKNLITTGRSVTFVIQNFKNDVGADEFDSWYGTWQDKMRQDKIMDKFKNLRNNIEKQGKLERSSITLKIDSLNTADLAKIPVPHNAVGRFLFDSLGRSGWIVDIGNGQTDKIFFNMPDSVKASISYEIKDFDDLDGISSDDAIKYYYWFLLDVYHDFMRFIKSKG